MLRLKRTVQPTLEPITTAEAMEHLRIDSSAEETYVSGLVSAAREYCEDRTNSTFLTTTWALTLDCWPSRGSGVDAYRVDLPRCPVQSISSIAYIDPDGNSQTLASSLYRVDTSSDVVCRVTPAYGETWPDLRYDTGVVTITYLAGRTLPSDVPPRIRHAIKLLVGHWYENRETVLVGSISKQFEFALDALLGLEDLSTVG